MCEGGEHSVLVWKPLKYINETACGVCLYAHSFHTCVHVCMGGYICSNSFCGFVVVCVCVCVCVAVCVCVCVVVVCVYTWIPCKCVLNCACINASTYSEHAHSVRTHICVTRINVFFCNCATTRMCVCACVSCLCECDSALHGPRACLNDSSSDRALLTVWTQPGSSGGCEEEALLVLCLGRHWHSRGDEQVGWDI